MEIKEDGKEAKIRANLSTLILFIDSKRVWEKPLIGSYSVIGGGDYKTGKIKLSC